MCILTWLILGTKRCAGINRIDVAADVHVEVSRAKECDVTMLKIMPCALVRLKRVRFKNIFYEFICQVLFIKGPK
jgi:hypothetical protein